jgi:hypothetical protein
MEDSNPARERRHFVALFSEGGLRAIECRAWREHFWPGVCGKHHSIVVCYLWLVKKAAASLLFGTASGAAECQRFLNAECPY